MRVFLSWSGTRSRMLAEALRDWLPSVLQVVQPWMSAVDMQMGTRWNADLAQELQTAKVGIICVTSDNQNAPWMLFEAGALSKIVETQCVIPYLLNMRPGEVEGPLVQFQSAVADREDTFKVVSTVNRSLGDLALSAEGLERSFEKWWPDLADAIASIPGVVKGDPPPRPERELLEEILNLSRQATREQIERIALAESVARARQEDMMVMTHEIHGPLISVAAMLSFAKHEVTGTARSHIEDAREKVEDVLVFSHGIFAAFATTQGQRLSSIPVEMNVQETLRNLAARIQRTNARSDLRFRFNEPDDFPTLLLDQESFTSVLYALIHNAAKYADKDSDVTFECSLAGSDRMPVLRVTSTGEPIPPTDRERVFEKFARTSQGENRRRYEGVGLGLWVARELMRQLGGDVTLELSTHDPRVSRFVVHFGSRSVT